MSLPAELLAWGVTVWLHSGLLALGAWAYHGLARGRGWPELESLWRVALLGGVVTASVQGLLGSVWSLGLIELDDRDAGVRMEGGAGESAVVGMVPGELLAAGPAPADRGSSSAPAVAGSRSAAVPATPGSRSAGADLARGAGERADPSPTSARERGRGGRLEPVSIDVAQRRGGGLIPRSLRDDSRRGRARPAPSSRPARTGRDGSVRASTSPPAEGASPSPLSPSLHSGSSLSPSSHSASSPYPALPSASSPSASTARRPASEPVARASSRDRDSRGPLVLGLAWLCSAALVALAWARSRRGVARLLRGRRPLQDHPVRETLDELITAAGTRRTVHLSVCDELPAPISVGVWRHEIVLPGRALRDLSPRQLRALLGHELAHGLRRDGLWLRVHLLVRLVAGLQPLHYLTVANLRRLAERDCDERAARWCGSRLDVAATLTEVAAWRHAPSALASAVSGASRNELVRRIESMLERRPPRSAGRLTRTSLSLGLALSVLLAPGLVARSLTETVPQNHARVVPDASKGEASPDDALAPARDLAWEEWTLLTQQIRALEAEAAELGDDPEVARALQRLLRRESSLHRLLTEALPRPATERSDGTPPRIRSDQTDEEDV